MEQEGTEGNILVSDQTRKLLEKGNKGFLFEKKKKIEFPELKLAAPIQAYLICKKSTTSFSDKSKSDESD